MTFETHEVTFYKGFAVEANPQKSSESRQWSTYFVIRREGPAGAKHRTFEDDKTFSARIDAVRYCFTFGRQIIDGKVDGLSVDDL